MKEQLNDSSTAETVKVIKTFGITILIVIAATIWISAYDNLISRVEDLESKIDSITTSSNNYSYSHITTFENKTPEEGIDEALLYYNIKHPTIVKAQAILETAHFSSDLCVKNNNLFGLYDRWYPHIDIIKRFNKHTIILWYNKRISKDEVMRTYIKLYEYEI